MSFKNRSKAIARAFKSKLVKVVKSLGSQKSTSTNSKHTGLIEEESHTAACPDRPCPDPPSTEHHEYTRFNGNQNLTLPNAEHIIRNSSPRPLDHESSQESDRTASISSTVRRGRCISISAQNGEPSSSRQRPRKKSPYPSESSKDRRALSASSSAGTNSSCHSWDSTSTIYPGSEGSSSSLGPDQRSLRRESATSVGGRSESPSGDDILSQDEESGRLALHRTSSPTHHRVSPSEAPKRSEILRNRNRVPANMLGMGTQARARRLRESAREQEAARRAEPEPEPVPEPEPEPELEPEEEPEPLPPPPRGLKWQPCPRRDVYRKQAFERTVVSTAKGIQLNLSRSVNSLDAGVASQSSQMIVQASCKLIDCHKEIESVKRISEMAKKRLKRLFEGEMYLKPLRHKTRPSSLRNCELLPKEPPSTSDPQMSGAIVLDVTSRDDSVYDHVHDARAMNTAAIMDAPSGSSRETSGPRSMENEQPASENAPDERRDSAINMPEEIAKPIRPEDEKQENSEHSSPRKPLMKR